MTSLYASEIGSHFSKRKHDVKAFLFVQINRDVTRCVSETRVAISSNNDSRTANFCERSIVYTTFDPLYFSREKWFETRRTRAAPHHEA